MQYDNLKNYSQSQSKQNGKLFNYFLKREKEKQVIQRNIFLHPPSDDFRLIVSNDSLIRINNINENLKLIQDSYDESSVHTTQLYWYEGLYSSLIENENSPFRVQQSMLSIQNHTEKSPTRNDVEYSLLETHNILMKDLDYAKPGQYRDVRVMIGNHIPPNPSLVPSLMDELFNFIHLNQNGEIITAAWSHICFESIHPFTDGNGRTGRSLVNNIFNLPIPLSKYIWNTRNNYYYVLDKANWNDYLEYFLLCLEKATKFMIKTIR